MKKARKKRGYGSGEYFKRDENVRVGGVVIRAVHDMDSCTVRFEDCGVDGR